MASQLSAKALLAASRSPANPDVAAVVAGLVTSSRQLHRKPPSWHNSLQTWPTTDSPSTASNAVCAHGATHLKTSDISCLLRPDCCWERAFHKHNADKRTLLRAR